MYPIKSRYPIAQRPQPQQTGFGSGMGELAMLIHQLQSLKQELLTMVNSKLKEVDEKVKDHVNTGEMIKDLHKRALGHIQTVKQGEKGKDADEEKITKKLEAKLPAPIDEDKLTKKILAQVPQIDEDKIVRKTLKAIPENKASLKIIQENFETDPVSIIEKIMALPPEKLKKLKLKQENIDGLSQTMQAFNSQLGRGFLHGGGTTLGPAGTGITLTNNANGTVTISATGGGGFTKLTATGTVNGSNTTFTFTQVPSEIVSDGVWLTALDNNGGTQWSNVGTTITMSVPPINSIFGVA